MTDSHVTPDRVQYEWVATCKHCGQKIHREGNVGAFTALARHWWRNHA